MVILGGLEVTEHMDTRTSAGRTRRVLIDCAELCQGSSVRNCGADRRPRDVRNKERSAKGVCLSETAARY